MIHRVNKIDVAELNRILELIQKDSTQGINNLNVYIKGIQSSGQASTSSGIGFDVVDLSGMLDAIDDDDILTTKEKRILVPLVDGWVADKTQLEPQVEALGFTPDNPDQYAIWTAYTTALDNVLTFLWGYGYNAAGVYNWRDTTADLPLGPGKGKTLRTLRDAYASTYAALRGAMWFVTYEIKITAELADSTAVQAAQDAPKVVNGLPALPNALYPASKLVYDTVTKRLYRSTGSAWESATVASGDIVGQLTSDQIASLVASKLSGQLTSDQIQSLVASKLSGQLTSDQIQSLVTSKLSGYVGSDQISSLVTSKLSGYVQGSQIAAETVTAGNLYAGSVMANRIQAANIAAGVITANEIYSGSVMANRIQAGNIAAGVITANEIYSGSVMANRIQAGNIAAGTITANEIYSGSVMANRIQAGNLAADSVTSNAIYSGSVTALKIQTNNIAADAITAGLIQAGAVGADEIAAYSVYAKHLVIADFDNLFTNPNGTPPGSGYSSTDPYDLNRWGTADGSSPTGYSHYIAGQGSECGVGYVSKPISVSGEEQYFVTGNFKVDSGSAGIYWYAQNSSGSTTGSGGVSTTSGSWTTRVMTIKVPAGSSTLRVYCYVPAGNAAHITSLYLRRCANADVMVDGTLTALFVKTGQIESNYYHPGGTADPPSGFHIASEPYPTTYLSGEPDTVIATLGGNVNIGGYKAATVADLAVNRTTKFTAGSSGTWVCPDHVYAIDVVAIAGGGSGGAGPSGGGGGGSVHMMIEVTPGNSYSYSVGSGGVGDSGTGYGGSGGNTTFGPITCTGGFGASVGASASYSGGVTDGTITIPNIAIGSSPNASCYPTAIHYAIAAGGAGGNATYNAGACGIFTGGNRSSGAGDFGGGGASAMAKGTNGTTGKSASPGYGAGSGASGGSSVTDGGPGLIIIRY